MTTNMIYLATIWVITGIIDITFHKAAQGFIAHLLGDDTAWRLAGDEPAGKAARPAKVSLTCMAAARRPF